MQSQLRLRAARPLLQPTRRLLATPAGIPPTPPPPSGAAPIRPVVVTSINPPPTPGSSTLPPAPPTVLVGAIPPKLPPPPPPPRKRSGFFRRFLLYSTVGALVFYPLSGWVSTRSETYREFFVDTFPGAEWVADQFEGDFAIGSGSGASGAAGSVSQKASEGWKKVTGEASNVTSSAQAQAQKIEQAAKDARAAAEKKAREARVEAEKKAHQLKVEAEKKAAEAKSALSSASASAQKKAEQAKVAAQDAAKKAEAEVAHLKNAAQDAAKKAEVEAANLRDRVVKAGHNAADKAKELAHDAKDKIAGAVPSIPFNANDGIEGAVREAEKLVNKGEAKLANAASAAKDAVTPHKAPIDPNAPRVLPDTQRPRELRPETVTPAKPSFEGKEKYSGPELPLGFEPPPGYYIPPPPKSVVSDKTSPAPVALPLLAPKVKDFATDEPIISQLASTIDSLASSLSAPVGSGTGTTTAGATGVLTKAQADLSALSARLSEVKKTEKAKLEKALADKAKEFEATLKSAEASRAQNEQGLQEKWVKERQGMVDEWKVKMEGELESQREGIEKRLREEVVSQGIELQRRWLRGIKAQVEEERGGRLAKLDHLTTSLKELEKITLDNSATLDDNVRLHKVWSALRAVQAKADAGDVSFDEELRVLKSLSTKSTDANAKATVVSSTLAQLESSGIPSTGVKSLSSLSSWFTSSVSPRIQSASLVPSPEHAGVVSHLASMGLSKIMFRPRATAGASTGAGGAVGGAQDGSVSSVLARAEWCLAEKDLDGATREINSLTGWPGKLASDWLREARRTLEVRQALEVVATEATLGSLLLV